MDFFRDFYRITRLKLLYTCALGLIPLALATGVMHQGNDNSRGLPAIFMPLSPLLNQMRDSSAARFLLHVSRPAERVYDLGIAFLAVCLVMLPVGSIRKNAYLVQSICAALFILSWIVLRIMAITGVITLYELPWYRVEAGTVIYDSAFCLFMTTIAFPVFGQGWTQEKLTRISRFLAIAMVAAQLTGMAYRYTGLVFSPNPSFALLLGGAYAFAPLQILLLYLMTCYLALQKKVSQ